MPCGEEIDTTESYLTICWTTISVPCGIRWCRGWLGIPYPCGLKWCSLRIPYPCIQSRRVKRYCYDFSSVGGTCYFVYEDVYGCCDGQEYNWGAACLFVSTSGPGSVDSSARNFRKCFDEPLTPIGPCRRGKSLPEVGDLPGGPIDPGSVSSRSPTGSGYVDERLSHWEAKLGRCTRCMVASVVLAGLGWLSFMVLPLDRFPFPLLSTLVFGALAVALTLPVVGHAIGLLTRLRHNI